MELLNNLMLGFGVAFTGITQAPGATLRASGS